MSAAPFSCPPDCGRCCSELERSVPRAEAAAQREFRSLLREQGVYHCRDPSTRGLSLSSAEAERLRVRAAERGQRIRLHPRTWLLDGRRRIAVVLDWHLAHASCPFYSDFRCTVYADRPLVCRAYPVVGLGGRLAPECPHVTPEARPALRAEARVRGKLERAHAALDARAWSLLDAPGARFSKGLAPGEANRRLQRYRLVAMEDYSLPAAPTETG